MQELKIMPDQNTVNSFKHHRDSCYFLQNSPLLYKVLRIAKRLKNWKTCLEVAISNVKKGYLKREASPFLKRYRALSKSE